MCKVSTPDLFLKYYQKISKILSFFLWFIGNDINRKSNDVYYGSHNACVFQIQNFTYFTYKLSWLDIKPWYESWISFRDPICIQFRLWVGWAIPFYIIDIGLLDILEVVCTYTGNSKKWIQIFKFVIFSKLNCIALTNEVQDKKKILLWRIFFLWRLFVIRTKVFYMLESNLINSQHLILFNW